MQEVTKE